jgi:hypothetical protein
MGAAMEFRSRRLQRAYPRLTVANGKVISARPIMVQMAIMRISSMAVPLSYKAQLTITANAPDQFK